MTEEAIPLDTPFATADAEGVSFRYAEGDLLLSFQDWHEEQVTVFFRDCVAVKWQDAESTGPEERDDRTYEIHHSRWVQLHLDQNVISSSSGHRHWRLCFNACGVLDVIAVGMELLPEANCESR